MRFAITKAGTAWRLWRVWSPDERSTLGTWASRAEALEIARGIGRGQGVYEVEDY